MRRARAIVAHAMVALAASSLSLGCASQMGLGRATTLARGTTEATVGLEAAVVGVKLSPTEPAPIPWAQLYAGVHRGLSDDVEVGARAWGVAIRGLSAFGLAGDAKLSLRKSEDVDLAVALSAAYHGVELGGFLWNSGTLTLPLLAGVHLGRHQLVFGPRLAGTVWGSEAMQTTWLFHAGAATAMSFAISNEVSIAPEAVFFYTPVGFNGTREDPDRRGATSLVLGLGLGLR